VLAVGVDGQRHREPARERGPHPADERGPLATVLLVSDELDPRFARNFTGLVPGAIVDDENRAALELRQRQEELVQDRAEGGLRLECGDHDARPPRKLG
jgi:hypothetical protein